ncbi:hypothetical protein K7711_38230 [Nocardia sp. CA2R105]|uniref:phosphotriesterase family protein n=1 Tax=Nocardia coffeae TaxID=2873381 RepID=UPI001CA663AB|nr:hypothetical protein [Nocardia coffeae]MBY8862362.1 hypothetical protein [Nocardia coffeae]
MAKSITTVRGEIAPEQLGMTTMHEHLNSDMTPLRIIAEQYSVQTPPPAMLTLTNENMAFLRSGAAIFSEESMTIGDIDYTAAELGHFRKVGGQAVVDASPIGLRGDVTQLRAASELADVHVICATGLYTATTRPPAFQGWSEKQQVAHFTREALDGIEGSDVRAGILKCALSAQTPNDSLSEIELTTLRACAQASLETGLSVHVHSAFPMTDEHVLEGVRVLLDDVGLPPDRLHMMHMDSFLRPWDSREKYLQSIDSVKSVRTDLLERVLDRGVTIGFDSWGSSVEILPQDDDRLKGLIHLIRKGYDARIVLGHDVTQKPEGVSFGGKGFNHFAQLVPRSLAQAGISEETYHRLTVDTPARILAH